MVHICGLAILVLLMVKGFTESLKQFIYHVQDGICAYPGCEEPIHSIHHRFENHKWRREKYPAFIHSAFNAVGLCQGCHDNNKNYFKLYEKDAIIYERIIQGLREEVKAVLKGELWKNYQ